MIRTLALAGVIAMASSSFALFDAAQRRPVDLEADCSTVNQMFGDFEVARATRRASIPVTAGTLEVRPDSNGGVRIERGAGGVYGITACIAAGASTGADAQAAADSVRLEVDGSRVSVRSDISTSRRARSWSVQLLIAAPEGASIIAQTSNGPIGAESFSGTLDLRADNGPISLQGVGGQVKARASNGPISVARSNGEVDIETANGPISVTLDGSRWDGHLTARAGNGPLTLTLPAAFQSGIEVRSSAHAPWSCRAAACTGTAVRDWDDTSRTLRVGGDPIVVKLSTGNGPVTVRQQ